MKRGRRKNKARKDYTKMSDRLFTLQLAMKAIKFWPLTLIINLGPTWFINQLGDSGPIMTFLTWVLFPPMLMIGEVVFLLMGSLAEIPAEMIADAIFPRLPTKHDFD